MRQVLGSRLPATLSTLTFWRCVLKSLRPSPSPGQTHVCVISTWIQPVPLWLRYTYIHILSMLQDRLFKIPVSLLFTSQVIPLYYLSCGRRGLSFWGADFFSHPHDLTNLCVVAGTIQKLMIHQCLKGFSCTFSETQVENPALANQFPWGTIGFPHLFACSAEGKASDWEETFVHDFRIAIRKGKCASAAAWRSHIPSL